MYVLYNIHEIVLLIKIMRKLYQILYNVGRLTDAPGGGLYPFQGDTLAWAGLREGEALGVAKAVSNAI